MRRSKKKTTKRKKAATKKASQRTRKKKPAPPKFLSPDDLQRFMGARAAVTRANMDRGLIVAGFEAMGQAIRDFYQVTGKFDVDPQTGLITELPGEDS